MNTPTIEDLRAIERAHFRSVARNKLPIARQALADAIERRKAQEVSTMSTTPPFTTLPWDDDIAEARCPACGSPIDFCQGHGEIGDPAGFALLAAHDDGDHTGCHPEGCDDASVAAKVAARFAAAADARWASQRRT